MDYMQNFGRLALGSRLKRISHTLFEEVNSFYKNHHIDLDANCFVLLNYITEFEPINLKQAELALQTSHADISQKTSKLVKTGFIKSQTDKSDGRSKLLTLTDKGHEAMQQIRPLWQAVDRTLASLIHPYEKEFFSAVKNLEKKLHSGDIAHLYKEQLKQTQNKTVQIIPYENKHKEVFKTLNTEWLEKHFSVEETDIKIFEDPINAIIKPGGYIFMAELDNEIVGTCALYKTDDTFELCKMGVDPRYRGFGIGKELIEAACNTAEQTGVDGIFLLTSKPLKSAQHLYEKLGFQEVELTKEDLIKYNRADIRMVKKF